MPFATLKEFIAHLKDAPIVPGTTGEADWRQHVEEISVPGQVVLITEEDWFYWLEALPPRILRGNVYCFAEGEEPFRLFWRASGSHFARQLTAEETLLFCNLAGIAPPAIALYHLTSEEERMLIERHMHHPIHDCCEGAQQ
jgi:hypothetical protein